MMELPEVKVISKQLNETIFGKRIIKAIAAQNPHKFAWYNGDPQKYNDLLAGKMIGTASGYGSMIEIKAEDAIILLSEGAGIRLHWKDEKRPLKHQLLIELEDLSAFSVSVQMYGGIWCFKEGDFQNQYYHQAKIKPSPVSDEFDRTYFNSLISAQGNEGLSAKALLATEQRIPGLGNGVLQDILYNARIHPKKKVKTFTDSDKDNLYDSIKVTLSQMISEGGRDTEKDLYGRFGGYRTKVSKNTAGGDCGSCGNKIRKEAYMGGSIYYCEGCQKI